MGIGKSSNDLSPPRPRIFIVGARGLLGNHIVDHFSCRFDVIAPLRQEFDITDGDLVWRRLRQDQPDAVINCAALSSVDACEKNPALATLINAQGPHHLAQAAADLGLELVHISTDYVFDGSKTTPYTCEDEAKPVNAYGASKLAGEQMVRQILRRHYIIRVARLFGRGGQNFASAAHQIACREGRLTAIVDEIGSPSYVVDVAKRIEMILESGQYGTYHVTNQGACSWDEFSEVVVRIARLDQVHIERVKSADLGRPAIRPRYTEMRCLLSERLGLAPLRPWPEAYAEYIHSLV